MSASLQPILLYGHGPTPNPIKVAIILEELGLPWTLKAVEFPAGVKAEPYISINPNGRVPSIEDPNTGVKLFESGAIVEYLVETYDKDNKLQYPESPEKWLQKSWLHFQVSGQGPYFGQKVWFERSHPEKIPSAVERYRNEIKRVTGVINEHLKKQGTPYLLGNKASYADLAWVPWQQMYPTYLISEWDFASEVPEFAAWRDRLASREAVRKVYAMKDFQLQSSGGH